jgi:hypothetical protein
MSCYFLRHLFLFVVLQAGSAVRTSSAAAGAVPNRQPAVTWCPHQKECGLELQLL